MKRPKELQEKVDSLAEKTFGESLTEAQKKKICVQCKKEAGEISDPMAKKEYEISGLCPSCQDEFFD
jgi:hypothetical protein